MGDGQDNAADTQAQNAEQPRDEGTRATGGAPQTDANAENKPSMEGAGIADTNVTRDAAGPSAAEVLAAASAAPSNGTAEAANSSAPSQGTALEVEQPKPAPIGNPNVQAVLDQARGKDVVVVVHGDGSASIAMPKAAAIPELLPATQVQSFKGVTSLDETHSQDAIAVKPVAAAGPIVAAGLPHPSVVERVGADIVTYLHRQATSLEDHERAYLAQAKQRLQLLADWLGQQFGV